ncbi:hypothetical protein Tco_0531158 [Tanacetum coccineum]
MPPPDPNNTHIQPPLEIQILEFIKTLGYDEDPETKLIAVSKMVATRLHQPWRAILSVLNRCLMRKDSSWDTTIERSSRPSKMSKLLYTHFTKLIIDYLLSLNKSIPCISDSKLHSSQDDHPITKLLNITNDDYKFGMEVHDAMISDAIKKIAGYKYYMAKKVEIANVPNKLKKYVVPRKTRSHTITDEAVVVTDTYAEWGQKLKGHAVDDPAVQSLLDLWKGSKASRLKSLRQKKQPVTGEGLSAAQNKYYSSSDTDSDATLYSSSLDKPKGSANETDDADESDMDLSNDNP